MTTSPTTSTTAGLPSRADLASTFRDPPAEYGPVDGWWWEAAHLDRAKLTWQLEEFKDKGISGTWFYPRFVYGEPLGSDPPYFSDGWWELVRFSTEEHERLGLTSWFSNWEGLQFTQERLRAERDANPAMWGRRLVLHRAEAATAGEVTIDIPPDDQVVDVAAYQWRGDQIDYETRQPLADAFADDELTDGRSAGGKVAWRAPGPGWLLTIVVARPWDLDYLSRLVGDRWSETFLGEYEKRVGEFMGRTLEAFGVDELALLNGNALFSQELLDRIKSERGYDATAYLIGLFYDIGQATSQIRCDYFGTMSTLLDENFYQPPTNWLAERGMKHASLSQLGAEELLEQVNLYGDAIRYLRSFHLPGNEDPFRTGAGERRLLQAKMSSSVAHLYGRQRVIVLAHYASGWGMTQEENLAWTNEAYAKGLNFYSRHLGQYTLMGGWYEWVPPADHFYHPYWRYWKPFADYVRRLSYIVSQGTHVADVAVLYPLSTIHAHWVVNRDNPESADSGGWGLTSGSSFQRSAIEAADATKSVATAIYHSGIDFDFVDDESMGRATSHDGVLEVAGIEFRALVLPPMTTISRATMETVKDFYDQGGTVVALGRLPTDSAEGGHDDPELRKLVTAVFGERPAQDATGELATNEHGGTAHLVPADPDRVPALISRSIVRDVVSSSPGIFHTHQRIGDGSGAVDVYFLFNAGLPEQSSGGVVSGIEEARQRGRSGLRDVSTPRDVSIRLRVDGDVEAWDPSTGDTRPIHRVHHKEGCTTVRLTMNPYEGVVLVCTRGATSPAVVDDDLSQISSVDVVDDVNSGRALVLRGFDATGGARTAHIVHGDTEYMASGEVAAPPDRIVVSGPFAFRVEPTMDNRWGDFRSPPSPTYIGPEARRFKYREETSTTTSPNPGTELGWHRADFDDADWPEVLYSYGPYWWQIGPFAAGTEPQEFVDSARRGDVQPWHRWRSAEPNNDSTLAWRPYEFSKMFGSAQPPRQHGFFDGFEHLLGVSDNFIVLDPGPSTPTATPTDLAQHHYLFTTVHAAEAGGHTLCLGQARQHDLVSDPSFDPSSNPYRVPAGTRAWINGEAVVLDADQPTSEVRVPVTLREGPNAVLLRLVQPDGGPVANYAVLRRSDPPTADPYVPLLRWFTVPDGIAYDITPDRDHRVGWYRFIAPPGVRALQLHTDARNVEAWIDGEPAPVNDGTITLASERTSVSQVALRVNQNTGTYAGAVFQEPVVFDCGGGTIPLGDWSQFGLATYSGIGVYGTTVTLDRVHTESRVVLDLGGVKTVAEVFVNGERAGVVFARPFSLDISDLVTIGSNRIEIKVANTLANHMSTYPTQWVFEGQTESGLLGPVELQFSTPVELTAS